MATSHFPPTPRALSKTSQNNLVTADPLTKEVSKRICKHMNQDHCDAVLAFAHHYGGLTNVRSASMVSISSQAMYLEADGRPLEILFPAQISNSAQAHRTIVEMLKQIPKIF